MLGMKSNKKTDMKSLRGDIAQDLHERIKVSKEDLFEAIDLIYRANWENGCEYVIIKHPNYDVVIAPKGRFFKNENKPEQK